jgi:hypothetical protein
LRGAERDHEVEQADRAPGPDQARSHPTEAGGRRRVHEATRDDREHTCHDVANARAMAEQLRDHTLRGLDQDRGADRDTEHVERNRPAQVHPVDGMA